MPLTDNINYSCQGVFLTEAKNGLVDAFINGVQSITFTDSFSSIIIKDIGRSQAINQFFGPNNEVTLERVWSNLLVNPADEPIDYQEGYLLNSANLGTVITGNEATDIRQFDLKLIYGDKDAEILSGTNLDILTFYKCLLTNINYSFSTTGAFKERLTFNNVITNKSIGEVPANDLPIYLEGGATRKDIVTRKDFDTIHSIFPSEVESFVEDGLILDNIPVKRITNIDVNVSINYKKIKDNGRWRGADVQSQVNLWTAVSLPIDITCTFTMNCTRAYANSILQSNRNFQEERIVLVVKIRDTESDNPKYYVVDLGSKNILTSFDISGASTTGDKLECKLSYKNNNNDFSNYVRIDTNIDDILQTTESY